MTEPLVIPGHIEAIPSPLHPLCLGCGKEVLGVNSEFKVTQRHHVYLCTKRHERIQDRGWHGRRRDHFKKSCLDKALFQLWSMRICVACGKSPLYPQDHELYVGYWDWGGSGPMCKECGANYAMARKYRELAEKMEAERQRAEAALEYKYAHRYAGAIFQRYGGWQGETAAEVIESARVFLRDSLDAAFNEGLEKGRALLRGLSEGSVTLAQLEDPGARRGRG